MKKFVTNRNRTLKQNQENRKYLIEQFFSAVFVVQEFLGGNCPNPSPPPPPIPEPPQKNNGSSLIALPELLSHDMQLHLFNSSKNLFFFLSKRRKKNEKRSHLNWLQDLSQDQKTCLTMLPLASRNIAI